jgi:hypothetical protein
VSYDARKAREDHAMLKFWGRISSINVRKVVLTAQLLEVCETDGYLLAVVSPTGVLLARPVN